MRVEVDVSDLTDLAYYIDGKCKHLEELLRSNPKYAEYLVKRQHFGDDWQLDPYIIQDLKGEDLIYLEIWEIDALSDSELLAYIEVQMSKGLIDNSEGAFPLVIALIVFLPFGLFFSIIEMISSSGPRLSFTLAIGLAATLIPFLLGIRFYRIRQSAIFKKRNIDLMAAREDTTFLDAIRRLASLTNVDNWKREEYERRLQFIEDTLAGYDS
ncbi:MAG: hypothetical protein ACFFE1_10310 [Candidatus Thorarchaeota archaeon]